MGEVQASRGSAGGNDQGLAFIFGAVCLNALWLTSGLNADDLAVLRDHAKAFGAQLHALTQLMAVNSFIKSGIVIDLAGGGHLAAWPHLF